MGVFRRHRVSGVDWVSERFALSLVVFIGPLGPFVLERLAFPDGRECFEDRCSRKYIAPVNVV